MSEWALGQYGDESFNDETINNVFNPYPGNNVHPNLARWLAGFSHLFFNEWINGTEAAAARYYNSIVYGGILALIVGFCVTQISFTYGVLSLILALGNIRLFGHAHVAQTDLLLALLWLASTFMTQAYIEKRSKSSLLFLGLLCGLLLSTKLTGAILYSLIIIRMLSLYDRKATVHVIFLFIVSCAIFAALHPQIWQQPQDWLVEFLYDFFNRKETTPIPTMAFGIRYGFEVPWYIPMTHVLITSSPLILIGCMLSLIFVFCSAAKLRHPQHGALVKNKWIWLVLSMSLPLVASSIPSLPSHDLERLTLPLQPIAIIIATIGYYSLPRKLLHTALLGHHRKYAYLSMLTVLAMAFSSLHLITALHQHPYQLTYFNGLVGGEAGAKTKGFDVAYLRTEFNIDAIIGINKSLPRNATLSNDYNFLYVTMLLSQEWGALRKDISIVTSEEHAQYRLIYARRGNMSPISESLYMERPDPIWALQKNNTDLLLLYKND